MSSLKSFFAENIVKVKTKTFVLSDRFKDDGKVAEWEIGCISAGENNDIKMQCFEANGRFNSGKYQAKLCVMCVMFPDLQSIQLQNSYGVHTAEELICGMLTPAEFEDLSKRVLEINGFKTEEELVEQAKN